MKQLILFLLLISIPVTVLFAQKDSLPIVSDSLKQAMVSTHSDSANLVKSKPGVDTTALNVASMLLKDSQDSHGISDSIKRTPDIVIKKPEIHEEGNLKIFSGKEELFYYLIFLFLLYGLVRYSFAKYFSDLFRVFFRTTLKQKQVREQLLQSPLPSVVMNIFFILSAGLYINFLLQHYQLLIADNFWLQYLYCSGILGAIYLGKYVGLKIIGWLFNVDAVADSYIFIVFIINKMLGLTLLPFFLFFAFAPSTLYSLALIGSFIVVGLLLAYRIILSYGAVRNEVKLNSFHFILYIAAVELLPLLLIYKLLLIIF